MGSNTFRIHQVPEILKKDVECFILNRFNGAKKTAINVFPGALPGIVFHHREGHPAIENIAVQSGRMFSPPTLFLHAAGTEASVMRFGAGSYTVIQVIFKPQAVKSLLGINASLLNEGAIEFHELSREDLNEQLLNTGSDHQRIDLLTRFLASKLEQQHARDILVEESLRLIHKSAGMIAMKRLLGYLNISERQFERRFTEAVGISPFSYIRVKRFNEALRLMKTGQYDTLTEVAHALNFHDQSHFIRDIKSFTGATPRSLTQKVNDFSHNQAGYSY